MEFVTVFESYRANQVHLLRSIFEQYGLRCRVLKAPVDKVWPKGIRLQVDKPQKDLAFQLMRENGFLGNRLMNTAERPSGRFWIYFCCGLLLVAIVAALIASFL